MSYGNIFNSYGGWGAQPSMTAPIYSQGSSYAPQNVPITFANNGGMIWVQGEAGAKSYLVSAGNTVQLMDAERPVFYIKETGHDGVPRPLRIFEYKEITPVAEQVATSSGVSREEYEELRKQLDRLTAMLSEPKEKEENHDKSAV